MVSDTDNDELIGQIYETALSPGDWVDLVDTITSWTDVPSDPPSGSVSTDIDSRRTPAEVEVLINHLDRAVRSSAYMHALEDRTRILNDMYNQMPWPMLMLDERMGVLDATRWRNRRCPAAHWRSCRTALCNSVTGSCASR